MTFSEKYRGFIAAKNKAAHCDDLDLEIPFRMCLEV